jgi:hypothetical protein
MAKHHPDLIMCRKQPGVAVGRLCEKCKHIIKPQRLVSALLLSVFPERQRLFLFSLS